MAKRDETRGAAHYELGANRARPSRTDIPGVFDMPIEPRFGTAYSWGVLQQTGNMRRAIELEHAVAKALPDKIRSVDSRVISLLPAFWQLSSGDVRSENAAKSA
jgi:hypothetical protein